MIKIIHPNNALRMLAGTLLLVCVQAKADLVTLNVNAIIVDVGGTYAGAMSTGQSMTGTFIYDTDEANADPGAITTPGGLPGHEFSSFYEFTGPPYGVSVSNLAASYSLGNSAPVGVVVNEDMPLTSDETGGFVSDGTYDWIEILGSTAIGLGGPETPPADGEEWTLALIGDTSWFSDGSVIPDSLPGTYTPLLVGVDLDAGGAEIGFVFASVILVPEPSSFALLGIGLAGLAWQRKRATS